MAADNESAEVRYRGWKLYRISYSFRGSRHTAMPQHSTNPSPPLVPLQFTSTNAVTPRRRFLPAVHREIISSQWRIRRGDDKSLNYEYRLIHVTHSGTAIWMIWRQHYFMTRSRELAASMAIARKLAIIAVRNAANSIRPAITAGSLVMHAVCRCRVQGI